MLPNRFLRVRSNEVLSENMGFMTVALEDGRVTVGESQVAESAYTASLQSLRSCFLRSQKVESFGLLFGREKTFEGICCVVVLQLLSLLLWSSSRKTNSCWHFNERESHFLSLQINFDEHFRCSAKAYNLQEFAGEMRNFAAKTSGSVNTCDFQGSIIPYTNTPQQIGSLCFFDR